jgi:hypothetical protein
MSAEVEAVLKLWDSCDGWIPGAAYKELADALGVPHERTLPQRLGGLSRPPDGARSRNIPMNIPTIGGES